MCSSLSLYLSLCVCVCECGIACVRPLSPCKLSRPQREKARAQKQLLLRNVASPAMCQDTLNQCAAVRQCELRVVVSLPSCRVEFLPKRERNERERESAHAARARTWEGGKQQLVSLRWKCTGSRSCSLAA